MHYLFPLRFKQIISPSIISFMNRFYKRFLLKPCSSEREDGAVSKGVRGGESAWLIVHSLKLSTNPSKAEKTPPSLLMMLRDREEERNPLKLCMAGLYGFGRIFPDSLMLEQAVTRFTAFVCLCCSASCCFFIRLQLLSVGFIVCTHSALYVIRRMYSKSITCRRSSV